MIRTFKLAALGAALACSNARAASFDCDGPTLTRVEKTICAREELGGLDEEMALAYRNAHMLARAPAEVAASQRHWLAARNRCEDAACVARSYKVRSNELRRTPRAARLAFDDPATGLHFRYLGNRAVKRCTADPGTVCYQLAGPGWPTAMSIS